jgi:hypothetical protein
MARRLLECLLNLGEPVQCARRLLPDHIGRSRVADRLGLAVQAVLQNGVDASVAERIRRQRALTRRLQPCRTKDSTGSARKETAQEPRIGFLGRTARMVGICE